MANDEKRLSDAMEQRDMETARADAAEKLANEWKRLCGERNSLWRKAAERAEAAEAENTRLMEELRRSQVSALEKDKPWPCSWDQYNEMHEQAKWTLGELNECNARLKKAEDAATQQRNEFNGIWNSNQEQLDAAYADAAQANERINELIQEKKEGWALAYEKNNQLRNAERRAIADGAHIASLQEENARLRDQIQALQEMRGKQ